MVLTDERLVERLPTAIPTESSPPTDEDEETDENSDDIEETEDVEGDEGDTVFIRTDPGRPPIGGPAVADGPSTSSANRKLPDNATIIKGMHTQNYLLSEEGYNRAK